MAPSPLPTSLEVCLFYETEPEEDSAGVRPAREGAGGEEPAAALPDPAHIQEAGPPGVGCGLRRSACAVVSPQPGDSKHETTA